MFVLLYVTADQVLPGALQSKLNLLPFLPAWQDQVGSTDLSQGSAFLWQDGVKGPFLGNLD